MLPNILRRGTDLAGGEWGHGDALATCRYCDPSLSGAHLDIAMYKDVMPLAVIDEDG